MIGLSGTLREWSGLTVIFSPTAGTWIFLYPMLNSIYGLNIWQRSSVPQVLARGNLTPDSSAAKSLDFAAYKLEIKGKSAKVDGAFIGHRTGRRRRGAIIHRADFL